MALASFAEQYDSLIENLQEKGIPQPRILVPAVVVLLLLAVLFFALPALSPQPATVQFTVLDSSNAPVPDAAVTLAVGQKILSATSDSRGFVTFKDVPAGQKLQVSVHAAGFPDLSQALAYDATAVKLAGLPTPASITFTATVLNDQRVPVQDAQVRLSPDTGAAFSDVTDSFGEVQAKLSDTQHVSVQVSKDGYQSAKKSVLLSDSSSVEIVLQKADALPSATPPASSFVLVSVTDGSGNAVQGVKASLIDSASQTTYRSGNTDSSGRARLDFVDPNLQFTISVTDPQHRYADYTSAYPQSAGPDPVAITLTAAAPNDQLLITVKDKSGNAVSGATVSAYDATHKSYISSVESDSDGNAALTLDAPSVFLTVYHDGFLPVGLHAKNKAAQAVTLVAADGKTVNANVTVVKGLEPAPEAQVQLFGADGFPLGVPDQTTAADGTATFSIPKSSTSVFAKASLSSSVGQSDRAVPQSDLSWTIALLPPNVPFRVSITDAVSGKSVSGATVRFVTTDSKATCTTADGACQSNVPAETEFRIVVEAAAYLPYQSATQVLTADSSVHSYAAKLYPKSLTQNAVVNFLGFFTEDGKTLRETSNAQRLQARFLVSLPAAGANDSARFSVFLANSPAPVASITSVDGTDVFFTGSDPQGACNPPASDNATDNAQWATFQFPAGFSGTQQLAVHFFVSPDSKPPSVLWIQYSLHGLRKSVPFVFPLDSDKLQQLVSQTAVAEADFCGQKTASQRLPISRDVLSCQGNYCARTVFITPDGVRRADSAQLQAGSPFGVDVSLVGLQGGISQVQASAPAAIQLISFGLASGAGSGNGTSSNFDTAPAVKTLLVPVSAAQNERVDLHLEAQAARATSLAELKFTVSDADGQSTDLSRSVIVSGTNRISATPSLQSLDAAVSQNLRVQVKDQFNKPVDDATVELFECDGAPLNGQTIQSTSSNGGTYSFKVQPSSIGTVGIRVSQPQFAPFEDCSLAVQSSDFLSADPQTLTLKGDTRTGTVSEKITLSSSLGVKSQVNSVVKCTDSNGTDASAPFTLSPKSLSLKDSATLNVQANKAAFTGSCQVTFTAKVNRDSVASALVSVDVDVQGPPRADQLCPIAQTGVKCLATADASALRCTRNSFACDDTSLSCYQCNLGPQTFPSQIALSVSNYQADDTQTFAIALENNPDECRVEGFTNNPALAPYGSNGASPLTPYGTPFGYGAPNAYYGYQPNAYTPYGTNPFLAAGSCGGYAAGYGYGGAAGAYPGYGTYPSNLVATNGYYPGTPGVLPTSPLAANPATNGANCQTIISKLSPQCQVYFTQYSPYNANQNFYGQSYRDPWANNLNPGFSSFNSYQYPQNRPSVKVSADCTRTEIHVSATYTGGDAQYAGQLGGNQQGFLVVRTGTTTQRIPIAVTVSTPFAPGGYPGSLPGGYPGGYYPSGFPSSQIPPQCILEYQQVLLQSQAAAQTPQAGLDETGLPDSIDVAYNKYTGEGTYERELKTPLGGTLSYSKVTNPAGATLSIRSSGNVLHVGVKCTKKNADSTYACDGDGTFKATWSFANIPSVQKERSIHVHQDDFAPSAIQLLVVGGTKDSAEYDASLDVGGKCSAKGGASISCTGSVIRASASSGGTGSLQIKGTDDYQVRSIPVYVSTLSSRSVTLDTSKDSDKGQVLPFTPELKVTPSCVPNDNLKALVFDCSTKALTLKTKTPVEGVYPQDGYLAIQFPDSRRAEVERPSVHVRIEKDGESGSDITLLVEEKVPNKIRFTYTFPDGDDATQRQINLQELTPAKKTLQVWKPADLTSQTDSKDYVPTAPATLDVGDYRLSATSKTKEGTPLKREALFSVGNSGAASSQPSVPDLTLIFKNKDFTVVRTTSKDELVITATFAGKNADWKRFELSVNGIKGASTTPKSYLVKEGVFQLKAATGDSSFKYGDKSLGLYDYVQEQMKSTGSATFLLAAFGQKSATDKSETTLGTASRTYPAASLNFEAPAGTGTQGGQPGGAPGGAPGSGPAVVPGSGPAGSPGKSTVPQPGQAFEMQPPAITAAKSGSGGYDAFNVVVSFTDPAQKAAKLKLVVKSSDTSKSTYSLEANADAIAGKSPLTVTIGAAQFAKMKEALQKLNPGNLVFTATVFDSGQKPLASKSTNYNWAQFLKQTTKRPADQTAPHGYDATTDSLNVADDAFSDDVVLTAVSAFKQDWGTPYGGNLASGFWVGDRKLDGNPVVSLSAVPSLRITLTQTVKRSDLFQKYDAMKKDQTLRFELRGENADGATDVIKRIESSKPIGQLVGPCTFDPNTPTAGAKKKLSAICYFQTGATAQPMDNGRIFEFMERQEAGTWDVTVPGNIPLISGPYHLQFTSPNAKFHVTGTPGGCNFWGVSPTNWASKHLKPITELQDIRLVPGDNNAFICGSVKNPFVPDDDVKVYLKQLKPMILAETNDADLSAKTTFDYAEVELSEPTPGTTSPGGAPGAPSVPSSPGGSPAPGAPNGAAALAPNCEYYLPNKKGILCHGMVAGQETQPLADGQKIQVVGFAGNLGPLFPNYRIGTQSVLVIPTGRFTECKRPAFDGASVSDIPVLGPVLSIIPWLGPAINNLKIPSWSWPPWDQEKVSSGKWWQCWDDGYQYRLEKTDYNAKTTDARVEFIDATGRNSCYKSSPFSQVCTVELSQCTDPLPNQHFRICYDSIGGAFKDRVQLHFQSDDGNKCGKYGPGQNWAFDGTPYTCSNAATTFKITNLDARHQNNVIDVEMSQSSGSGNFPDPTGRQCTWSDPKSVTCWLDAKGVSDDEKCTPLVPGGNGYRVCAWFIDETPKDLGGGVPYQVAMNVRGGTGVCNTGRVWGTTQTFGFNKQANDVYQNCIGQFKVSLNDVRKDSSGKTEASITYTEN